MVEIWKNEIAVEHIHESKARVSTAFSSSANTEMK